MVFQSPVLAGGLSPRPPTASAASQIECDVADVKGDLETSEQALRHRVA